MIAAAQATQPAVGDAYLVGRAQEGYLDAYELLVQRHSGMAYRVALRLTGNHHDAQDVAQEALIAAWENLPRFRARVVVPHLAVPDRHPPCAEQSQPRPPS